MTLEEGKIWGWEYFDHLPACLEGNDICCECGQPSEAGYLEMEVDFWLCPGCFHTMPCANSGCINVAETITLLVEISTGNLSMQWLCNSCFEDLVSAYNRLQMYGGPQPYRGGSLNRIDPKDIPVLKKRQKP